MIDEPAKRRDEAFSKQRKEIENLDASVVNSEKESYTYRHLDRNKGVESETTTRVSVTETIEKPVNSKKESEILQGKYKSVKRNKLELVLGIVCSAIIIAVTVILIVFVFMRM